MKNHLSLPLRSLEKHLLQITSLLLLGMTAALLLFLGSVQQAWASTQSDCYDALKTNMEGINYLQPALDELNDKSYADIEFSRYYKLDAFMLSPSITDEDSTTPRFEYRLYSFGRPTGYRHPPASIDDPFFDQWEEAAKEFIVMEDTLIDNTGTRHFLSCGIVHLEADNLMSVTADNIEFETEVVSLLKEDTDNRIWYSEGRSYGAQCFEATWKRFFVAPASTAGNNNIFTRYDWLEGYPAQKVTDFSALNSPTTSLTPEQEKKTLLAANILLADTATHATEAPALYKGIKPLVREGKDLLFPYYSAYEKMEQKFPDSTYKAMGGISFETVKKLLQDENPAVISAVFKTIPSYNKLTTYYKEKQAGTVEDNPVYDRYIADAKTYEKAVTEGLQAVENNPALIEEAKTIISAANANANAPIVTTTGNENGQRNINGVLVGPEIPGTTATEGVVAPVQSPMGFVWIIAVIALVLIVIALFMVKVQKTRMMTVIVILVLAVIGILMVLFTMGQTAQTSVLGTARKSTSFASHCLDSAEFNNYASIQSDVIPPDVVTPLMTGDTVSLEFHGDISNSNKFVSLCQDNKIIAIIPVYKKAETDTGRSYKLTVNLRAMQGGMNVINAAYVTGIDNNGNEITKSVGTICNVACDLNNPNKPFGEVEYLGAQAQGGVIGCFPPEVTSHQLLTGYDVPNSIYATTKPPNSSLSRGGFTLSEYEPKSSITFQVDDPPLPAPAPPRGGN